MSSHPLSDAVAMEDMQALQLNSPFCLVEDLKTNSTGILTISVDHRFSQSIHSWPSVLSHPQQSFNDSFQLFWRDLLGLWLLSSSDEPFQQEPPLLFVLVPDDVVVGEGEDIKYADNEP